MASKEELQQAWFKFLKTSSNNLEDVNDGFERECNHIHGFDKRDCNDFEISKLQKITAQRILDYDNDVEKVSSYCPLKLNSLLYCIIKTIIQF